MTTSTRTFTLFNLFCGIGAGARGFLQSRARLGEHGARFVSLGGIDNDELACADFEYLTGSPALCADVNAVSPEQLRAFVAVGSRRAGIAAMRRPDVIFLSPPCKGFSKLLSKDLAVTEKYEKLNRLVIQGLFLACETWRDELPPAILIENVPGIVTRGAHLLRQVKSLLAGYGYVFHEGIHDCGELGGLGQHRRRFLLVARLPSEVPAFIYRPPRLRVKGCGEILETLPLPDAAEAGPLHALPSLAWLNWVRLALIPAGGDWRDLPGMVNVDPAAQKAWEQRGEKTPGGRHWFKGKHGVQAWDKPSRAVIGGPSNGASNVADPRIVGTIGGGPVRSPAELQEMHLADAVRVGKTGENAARFKGRPGYMEVCAWDEPSRAVNGTATVSSSTGTTAVADPRVPEHRELRNPVPPGRQRRSVWARWDVRGWEQPAHTVAGPGMNGGFGVADPRVGVNGRGGQRFSDQYRMRGWDEPAGTITGETDIQAGAQSVADPRLGRGNTDATRGGALGVIAWDGPAPTVTGNMEAARGTTPANVADPRVCGALALAANPNRHEAKFRVTPWREPTGAVTGARPVTSGGPSVADPRVRCAPRAGTYGVLSWAQAAATVTGNARIDNGAFAVADPRFPGRLGCPVIIAEDGTWHRPLTTLELAALQGLPMRVNGKPLVLATMPSLGKKRRRAPSNWRERIGNAVPVQAAAAIGESILTALLASALGTWMLSNDGIWVRKDGVDEDTANAPWLNEDLAREEARFQAERW